ncbi:PD-(D/E)XK nuclease family protein (plasmid) [Bacillus bombysepticus]|nr:PD-(D/E)XK nuclease family protein [Bacillus bombysepticus]
MNSNFVDIVGYQFEKVHTGAIKWLLDSSNTQIKQNEKFKIIRNIYDLCYIPLPFECSNINSVECKTEYPIGKGKRVDLVIDILLTNGEIKHIVIEMKVDTIAKKDQLLATYNGFSEKEKKNTVFLLFLFGSSQICQIPEYEPFNTFCLNEILTAFNNIDCSHYIYTDWLQSLQGELVRSQTIKDELANLTYIKDKDYWRDNGYRTHFTAFYYIYDHLKSYSKKEIEWNIYSGNNNPIMNWNPGWLSKTISNKTIKFYWEFNYEDLILKVQLPKEGYISSQELQQLKDNIISIVSKIPRIQGNKVRMQSKPKIYNSLYKWKFNFLTGNFKNIMKNTEFIINNIHPLLESSNWEFK